MEMSKKERIRELLRDVEKRHQVRVLYAAEAGSRAWGFPSPDSDWDVRFIYVHRLPWYVSVEQKRDVIEEMHDAVLVDLGGWELRKTLGLFRKWNPALMEWLSSHTVDTDAEGLAMQLRMRRDTDLSLRSAVLHYMSLAFGNYAQYLNGRKQVRLKKYLYVVRALLRAEVLLQTGKFGSITLQDDMDLVLPDGAVRYAMDRLLKEKMLNTELGEGDRIGVLDDWIDARLEDLRERALALPKVPPIEVDALDRLLHHYVV